MDEDASSDIQKCLTDEPMDADEGPVLNENSNGLSHLLTEGEFNSVDAVGVDESSASNPGFLNAVELSTSSVGDYLENNTGFNADSFDVGDNAVTFPSDSLNNVLSDGDSRLSDSGYKVFASDTDGDFTVNRQEKMDTNELSNGTSIEAIADSSVNETLEDTNTSIPQDITMDIPNLESNAGDNSIESFVEKVGDDKADDNTKFTAENDSVVKLNEEKLEDLKNSDSINSVKKVVEDEKDMEAKSETDEVSNKDMQPETNTDPIAVTVDVSKDGDKLQIDEVVAEKQEKSEDPVEITAAEATTEKQKISVEKEKIGGAEETEVVSEDELPVVEKPSIKDAENVSDDELPEPKAAELPADTEVVSEDEFPASKKDAKETRKRKTDDDKDEKPTEEESASKKQAVAKNGESKPVPSEKRSSIDEKPKKKALPELEKYWKVVKDDSTDFTGWTYLLQYVDQESEVEAARDAYDAFLSHYPYCYGYWRKYADYEKRKGSKKKCLEVLERGLKAIPLSVDLWIHYLNHIKATRTEDHLYIRSQYERAIEACGLEFRSDRLWESYIKWEAENGSALHVTNIYDRLLATPTLGYTSHFDNFQEHVMSEPVSGVIPREEIVRLRAEVREGGGPAPPPLDLPPGEDEPSDHVASEEEAQAIKERIIAARRKVHKATGEQVAARWTYEEGIKRPYFHVKPLERCQLKNWKSYLEWEKQHGSLKRALVLHERCLIACALYDQFWMRLIKFLEERSEADPSLVEKEREVLERACTIHHQDKPELHLYWAHFEEALGDADKAADILDRIEKTCPNVVQIQYRRINLERRRGDYDKCCQLYDTYIASAKNKSIASALSIKYARFLFHVKKDLAAARKALDDAVTKDPLNDRLHLQRLDLALLVPETPYSELDELVQSYSKQENADVEACAAFAWRRRELAEELGDAAAARRAHLAAKQLYKHLRKTKRAKHEHQPPPPVTAPPSSSNTTTEIAKKKETPSSSNNSNSGGAANNSGYYGGGQYDQQQYQYPPWGYQQPPAPYPHHPPWPNYTNYY